MNPKILLVEDDPFLREGLTELLLHEQYAVTAVACARVARDAIVLDAYALAILDVGLPDGDGVSLCREWRSAGHRLPILFLTPTEFKILAALVRNSGQILPRQLLLERIWDEGGQFIDDNTLTVNITRLRKKLEEHGLPDFIQTKKGLGYQVNV